MGAGDEQWPLKVIEGSTCTQTHLYRHSFEVMMLAYEARFDGQTHPRLPSMVGHSTKYRAADEQLGVETYAKTVVVSGEIPWVIARATGLETMEIVQDVVLDKLTRRITMLARNITWRDRLQLDETCTHPAE